MDEFNVTFSDEFVKELKNAKLLSSFLSYLPEDLAKQARVIFRAFAKNGVPPEVVMKALADFVEEGGTDNG